MTTVDEDHDKVVVEGRKLQESVDRLNVIANDHPTPPFTSIDVWVVALDEVKRNTEILNTAYREYWDIRNRQ